MKTENILVFTRRDGLKLENYAIVKVVSEEALNNQQALERFQKGVSHWINTTSTGRSAWESSCEDFNVGDFAHYEEDGELAASLSEQGVSVEIIVANEPHEEHSYDLVLGSEVEENEE